MNPIDNYILSKPEPWRAMLIELQAVIKHTLPEVEETYKWHLPFYSLNGKMLCLLNFRKSFVDLGFTWGILLVEYKEHLVAGEKRKNLRSLRYHTAAEIDIEMIQKILIDASHINGYKASSK